MLRKEGGLSSISIAHTNTHTLSLTVTHSLSLSLSSSLSLSVFVCSRKERVLLYYKCFKEWVLKNVCTFLLAMSSLTKFEIEENKKWFSKIICLILRHIPHRYFCTQNCNINIRRWWDLLIILSLGFNDQAMYALKTYLGLSIEICCLTLSNVVIYFITIMQYCVQNI